MSSANDRLAERAARYLARLPAAVSGQGGHRATFAAAIALIHGFALDAAEAMPFLQAYNARCAPSWTDHELRHKSPAPPGSPGTRSRAGICDSAKRTTGDCQRYRPFRAPPDK